MQICLNLTQGRYIQYKNYSVFPVKMKRKTLTAEIGLSLNFLPLQKGYSIFIIFCAIYLNCVFISILYSISWSFLCSFPLWNYIFIQWKWSYLKMAFLIWWFSCNFRFYLDFFSFFFIPTWFISLINCSTFLWNMYFWCIFLTETNFICYSTSLFYVMWIFHCHWYWK